MSAATCSKLSALIQANYEILKYVERKRLLSVRSEKQYVLTLIEPESVQPLLSAPSSKLSLNVPKTLEICAALTLRALPPRDASHDQFIMP